MAFFTKENRLPITLSFIVGAVLGIIISLLVISGSAKLPNEGVYQLLLPTKSDVSGEVLVTIDDNYAISEDYFNVLFDETWKGLSEPEKGKLVGKEGILRNQLLESLISENTLLLSAMQDGLFDDKDFAPILHHTILQAVAQAYLLYNQPKEGNSFEATATEIEQAYEAQRDQIQASGLKASDAKNLLTRQISQSKQQRWVQSFVQKNREAFTIQRNNKAISALGIGSEVPTPVDMQSKE